MVLVSLLGGSCCYVDQNGILGCKLQLLFELEPQGCNGSSVGRAGGGGGRRGLESHHPSCVHHRGKGRPDMLATTNAFHRVQTPVTTGHLMREHAKGRDLIQGALQGYLNEVRNPRGASMAPLGTNGKAPEAN